MKDEALKLALEALEKSVATCFDRYSHEQVMSRPEHFINQAIAAIKQALAAPTVQEPVAWRWTNGKGWLTYGELQHDRFESTPLYTTPPAAQPAVPDAFGTREGEHPQYIQGWNDCRAEMLKGMKP
jgi:hypothetical protein